MAYNPQPWPLDWGITLITSNRNLSVNGLTKEHTCFFRSRTQSSLESSCQKSRLCLSPLSKNVVILHTVTQWFSFICNICIYFSFNGTTSKD